MATPARRRPRAALRRAVAAAGLVLAAAGCGREVDSASPAPARAGLEPAYGDTLVEAVLGNVSSLIPNLTSDVASHEVGDLLYDALITLDRDLNPVPSLAEAWTFSSDCRELRLRLRRDVRWHDGQPFTAADVIFTYRATVDPRVPSPYKADFAEVEGVEAVDDHTVVVRFRRPFARALTVAASHPILPRHLLEPYVRDGKIREAPQNWVRPVGTGAYRFKELTAGEKIVVVANPDYFGGRPYIARRVFRVIPSQATQFLELKAQAVDLMGLTALQYARQTSYPAFRKAYEKYRYPDRVYTYFGFNLRDPRFADRRVRQAFAHAIDKRALIEGVRLGLGREATGPYQPGTWAYTDRVRTYPHDLARARALLAEAGWRERNADGLLVKDGRPFTFEVLTNQGNDERKKVAEIVQAALRELG
ncbi:MAG TPA: ABC transporter substrate-binding protein, partial [Methylomirabilota bacterium]|nr:ABC transporter substrate-binding protein [Methylomirabilota bacterium]